MRLKNILFVTALCILLFVSISFLGVLFDPVIGQSRGYSFYKYESEPKNSLDLLVLGTSFAYCAYSPMDAFNNYGITSYLVAAPEQTIDKTYEYVLRALQTQTPKVIYLELKGLSFEIKEQQSVEISKGNIYEDLKIAISGRRVSGNVPFYNFFSYHSRWKNLKDENYVGAARYFTQNNNTDFTKGFVLLNGKILELELNYDEVSTLPKYFPKNISFLDKIYEVCNSRNIKLVFLLTPSVNVDYFNNYEKAIKEKYPNIPLINFNNITKQISFDYYTDMYDWGHTNYSGAIKVTNYLAEYARSLGAQDKSNDVQYINWKDDYIKFKKKYVLNK